MKKCLKRTITVFLAALIVANSNSMAFTEVKAASEVIFSAPEEIKVAKIVTERNNNINSGWKFYKGELSEAYAKGFVDSDWQNVNLPHDFSITEHFDTRGEAESGFLLGGTGWYRKTFSLPSELKDKEFVLNFDGAYKDTYVYVNGNYVGENHYGYSPFSFNITEYLTCDDGTDNVIAVKVDHQLPSSRWYSGSGIYRDVNLIVTDKVHVKVDGTEVTTPDIAAGNGNVKYKLEVENASDKEVDVTINSQIYDNGNMLVSSSVQKNIGGGSEHKFDIEGLTVPNPKKWDIDSPNMYTLKTELVSDGRVLDTYETKFGFRYFGFDDTNGFSLNGRNIKLNGMCMHHDLGALGAAAYYDGMHRQLKIMKDMGANSIRITHNPADKRYLDICNELGLIVIEELFDGWDSPKNSNTKDFSEYFNKNIKPENKIIGGIENGSTKTWAEFVTKSVVRRDRNNPSIILWSLGNELQEEAADSSNFKNITPKLIQWVSEEDSARKVTSGDNTKAGNGDITPVLKSIKDSGGIVGFNYANSNQLDSLKNTYGCFISSETSSHINSRGIYNKYTSDSDSIKIQHGADGKYHLISYDNSKVGWGKTSSESMYDTLTRDHVAGEYVWTGFDYIGEPTPWWEGNRTGAAQYGTPTYPNSSYFGTVETTGFPKDSYYLYRSQWKRDGKTCHLVTAWDEGNMYNEGNKTPVVLYSDAKKVELFRGDTKIAEAEREDVTTNAGHTYHTYKTKSLEPTICTTTSINGHKGLFAEFYVAFEKGKIEAKAYGENGELINDTYGNSVVTTPEAANNISLKADKTQLMADGKSLSFITIDITDENGVLDTKAKNKINLTLEGVGEIAGVDNGDQATERKYQNSLVLDEGRKSANIDVFSGKALVVVRSLKEGGSITLKATSENGNMTATEINLNVQAMGGSQGNQIVGYTMSRHCYVPLGVENINIPQTVHVKYADKTETDMPVVWENYDKNLLKKSGDFTISGKIGEVNTSIAVHVYGKIVVVKNYSDITKPSTMPILPKKLMSYTNEGKSFMEADVEWDMTDINEASFKDAETIVTIKGKARILKQEFDVLANIRVATPETGKVINIASQAELTQSCTNPSDNLDAIKDGVKYCTPANTAGRWTNWKDRNEADNPVITMTWATGQLVDGINLYYFTEANSKSEEPTSVKISAANNDTNFKNVEYTEEAMEDVESTDNKVKSEKGHSFKFTSPVPLTVMKIELGHTAGNYIGLSEAEVISKEIVYNKKTTAELSSLLINGSEIALKSGTLHYETEAVTRDKVEAKGKDNAAVTVIPVGDNKVKVIAVSEDGNTTAEYEVLFTKIKTNEGSSSGGSGSNSSSSSQSVAPVVPTAPSKEDKKTEATKTESKKTETEKEKDNKEPQNTPDTTKKILEKNISKTLLETISKNKSDLELESNGYKWKLKGKSIDGKALDKINGDLDFSVRSLDKKGQKAVKKMLEKTIKADKENSGKAKILDYMSFSFKGKYPVKAELTCNIGKKYAGKTVFLSFADGINKKLKTGCYAVVDSKGDVTFEEPHVSDKVIITDKNPNLPVIAKNITIKKGNKINISKYIKNMLNGDKLSFKIKGSSIVKISKKGKVTAKKTGNTIVNIKYMQGGIVYKLKVKIKVK